MLRCSIFVLALGMAALPSAAMPSSVDAMRCRELIAAFDRLEPEYDKATAQRDRLIGEAECRRGNYARGKELLESAFHSAGFEVPPS